MDPVPIKRKPRSGIVEPCAQSGGVPEPTSEYLKQAAGESRRLQTAQPLLIVSDLNGTMLYRPNSFLHPKDFVRRPFAALFLDYMIKNFWVAFWSSARPENVQHMVHKLINPKAKDKVVVIWDRTRFGLTSEDYNKRAQCYKRLTRLWEDPDVARTHPHYDSGGRWSQANTVLIDDTSTKARSEPFNLIEIPEFENKKEKYDLVLPQVHDYINELAFQSDVSAYMMAHPFRPVDDVNPETPSQSMTAIYEPRNKRFAEARAKKSRTETRRLVE